MLEIALIGNRIRECRKNRRLSQEALAELMGVKFQSIHQWEAGKVTPRPHRITLLAEILHTSPEWIQFGIAKPSANNINEIKHTIENIQPQLHRSLKNGLDKLIKLGWIQQLKAEVTTELLADVIFEQIRSDIE